MARRQHTFLELPDRMNELWDWVCAIDAWDYDHCEPLAKLISDTRGIPEEFAPIISSIVKGERKPNKKAAAKLKVPAQERMRIAGTISVVLGVLDIAQYDQIDDQHEGKGAVVIAGRNGTEPIEVIADMNAERVELLNEASNELGISNSTLKELLSDLTRKIQSWPNI